MFVLLPRSVNGKNICASRIKNVDFAWKSNSNSDENSIWTLQAILDEFYGMFVRSDFLFLNSRRRKSFVENYSENILRSALVQLSFGFVRYRL